MNLKLSLSIKQRRQLSYGIEIVFLLFLFVFYFMWACHQPFNSAPDEKMRYDIPQYIYEHGALPHGGDPEIRDENWGISYAFNPILSYIISAAFMKIVSFFTTDFFSLLVAARTVSVVWGVITGFFTIRISKKLIPKTYRPLFIVLVTLLPQMAYLASYVNTDAMAIASTSIIIYMWIIGLETNWNKKSCIGLAIGLALCSLSYYNAYGYILCSILLFVFSTLFMGEKKYNCQLMIKKGLLITFIALLLAGWWFIRSYIIYDGDILGMATSRKYSELYAVDAFKPSNRVTYKSGGYSIINMLFSKGGWIETTKFSFIGCFGYMERYLGVRTYDRYIYLIAAGGVGVIFSFPKLFRPTKNKQWIRANILNIILAIAMVIPVFLTIYYAYASDYQAQGRYVMPMIIPLMYFAVTGVKRILDFFIKEERIPIITHVYAIILFITVLQTYKNIFLTMFQ
ncbi:hypothetical protein NE689_06900 [Lactonifactor longoviformis]|uniref:ArnT family glycosyltransferase n=1 Tax=Lactonifactor TaxID=420345 RepID=UPI0012B11B7E|nr:MULTISPECIES: hypothetical protein [Lactonifactor]MCQ4671044.1 hypothetical protein [Lactonifactor longoviformis]MRZ99969.1 hypothetical protein [Lactonifactor sp. BIOML-A5]MSA07214.1 hypothetical protein [Lactonifactor sp. BIOML-A4]MSA11313.1 hypothetical protein [Lactonifactor sp. BIOML-A3]MSA15541.1 hypothetical protein [Lactonifactor sp. BIOML-A2]